MLALISSAILTISPPPLWRGELQGSSEFETLFTCPDCPPDPTFAALFRGGALAFGIERNVLSFLSLGGRASLSVGTKPSVGLWATAIRGEGQATATVDVSENNSLRFRLTGGPSLGSELGTDGERPSAILWLSGSLSVGFVHRMQAQRYLAIEVGYRPCGFAVAEPVISPVCIANLVSAGFTIGDAIDW